MTQNQKITVVILDDHAVVRAGIRSQLVGVDDIEVVGEGGSGEQLERLISKYRPNVVLLDIEMPQKEGEKVRMGAESFRALYAITRMQALYPGTCFLIVSQHLDRAIVEALMDSGASGYLLKDDAVSVQLAMAVRTVHQGGVCLSREVSQKLMRESPMFPEAESLTEREQDVLRQMILNVNEKQADLAVILGITEPTFRNHLRSIREKLGVRSTAAAIIKGIQIGLAPLESISFPHDDA